MQQPRLQKEANTGQSTMPVGLEAGGEKDPLPNWVALFHFIKTEAINDVIIDHAD